MAPVQYENIHWIISGWIPKIHKVKSDRSPIKRATVPILGLVTPTLWCMWRHTVTSWDVLSARMAPVRYGHIPWGISGWIPKIHKVKSDRLPITRTSVPKLGLVTPITVRYVTTIVHKLGCTVGTNDSRAVRKYTLDNFGLDPQNTQGEIG